MKFDLIQTLAIAGAVLLAGQWLRRVVRAIDDFNIPTPVVSGLLFSVLALIREECGAEPLQFDLTLKDPLMIGFFTSIGFGVSGALLRRGGPPVLLFLFLATVFAALQNVVGASIAVGLGERPLLGVLCGAVTLTGGPATGLAFAPQFEQAGISGAASIAIAAAMLGIIAAAILGGPLGTILIRSYGLRAELPTRPSDLPPTTAEVLVEDPLNGSPEARASSGDLNASGVMTSLIWILLAMAAGSWISRQIADRGITLPAYIGAMIVAAGFRNLDDVTGWLRLPQWTINQLGTVALSYFLALALMSLELRQLADLALPLCLILTAQIMLICGSVWLVFYAMGRDYDAAVAASGFCGFMLGITANAMGNMNTIVEKHGPAPRAFLVVPMVGAFFLDFTNAGIITAALAFLK